MTRDWQPLGVFLRQAKWDEELARIEGYILRSSARDALRRPRNLLKALLSPLDFPRYAEVPFLLAAFPEGAAGRVLDIASPKWPAAYLAWRHPGLRVTASDISGYFVPWLTRLSRRQGTEERLLSHVCDARRLPFPDACFDSIYSLSVFEHVEPEPGGDREASREAFRVLKPGGSFLLTVPMGPAYQTRAMPWDGLFERRYTLDSLKAAVIDGVGWDADFDRSWVMFEKEEPPYEGKVGGWIDCALVGSSLWQYRCRARYRRRAMRTFSLAALTASMSGAPVHPPAGAIPSHLLLRLRKP